MTRQEIHTFLDGLGRFGWRLGLDNIRCLLSQLGNPQRLFPVIHIAGTNGKGSTAAFIESSLRAAGYRTGLYTSPHLVGVNERIQVDGRPIPWQQLGDILDGILGQVTSLSATYFETLTAVALRFFADEHVDVAVIEVGLGGRLDATNVVEPVLTVITPIGLDHCDHLGSNVRAIAAEKAGIMKPGVPCVAAGMSRAALDVLHLRAAAQRVRLVLAPEICVAAHIRLAPDHSQVRFRIREECEVPVRLGLPGRHQVSNAVTAVAALEVLRGEGWRIGRREISDGLARVEWPGRLQRLLERPVLVLDVAHNPAAVRQLLRSLLEIYGERRQLSFVVGALSDKRVRAMIRVLCRHACRMWCVPVASDRSAQPEMLQSIAAGFGVAASVCAGPVEAVEAALEAASAAEELICVTGSHYAVGPVLAKLSEKDLTNRG